MKTSTKSVPDIEYRFLIKTFFLCLMAVAFSVAALPARADKAEDDAKAALEAWKNAANGVTDAKTKLRKAHEKVEIAAAKAAKSGKEQTPEQQQQLEDLRAEEAAAAAELEKAEAALAAARLALENALAALPDDSDLRKKLKKERDGFILDNPDARGPSTRQNNVSAQSQNIPPVTKTGGGLQVTTFDTASGRVIVNLPDDMMAGDTISGTVIVEPRKNKPEDWKANVESMKKLALEIGSRPIEPFSVVCEEKNVKPCQAIFFLYHADERQLKTRVVLKSKEGNELAQTEFSVRPRSPGAVVTPGDSATTPGFNIPPLGQAGRSIRISGPFDGDSSNTTLRIRGQGLQIIAESPRKIVVTSPTNVVGATEIQVKEGTTETAGAFRNLKLDLTAPKTTLRRGESTELHVQVNGLEGLKEPVPLTIESQGVITMTGGNYQPLTIQPSQVAADGSYSTTRGVTGVQAGGWSATATVVTSPFNACFEPDNPVAPKLIRLNTFTGDYMFSCPGGSSATASSGPITGKGTVEMKGCVFTLTHNAPDRRIHMTIDQCTKSGSATVEMPANAIKFTVAETSLGDCDNLDPCSWAAVRTRDVRALWTSD